MVLNRDRPTGIDVLLFYRVAYQQLDSEIRHGMRRNINEPRVCLRWLPVLSFLAGFGPFSRTFECPLGKARAMEPVSCPILTANDAAAQYDDVPAQCLPRTFWLPRLSACLVLSC